MKQIFTYEKNHNPISINDIIKDDKNNSYQVISIQQFNQKTSSITKLAYGDSINLLDLQKNHVYYYDNTDFKNEVSKL